MRNLVKGDDKCHLEVVHDDKLIENGMNLFHAVGQGAKCPPRCVIVKYKGNPNSDEIETAFIGKGITYDTGGLNIKPTGAMEDMYGDKGGSCAVIGALKGTIELGLKKNLVFACAFAENAIGSGSYKPSDIIKAMNGLHVEIGNTDAEGRLVLADTFTYVQKNYSPKRIVDLATLTGAVRIAIGGETAGLFSNDKSLVREIEDAGETSFEPVWHLPITEEHNNKIKGAYGDISNLGSPPRFGGACTAAAFLQKFVEKGVNWAHIDIAGPAMATSAKPPVCADQTGFGAALLLNYLK